MSKTKGKKGLMFAAPKLILQMPVLILPIVGIVYLIAGTAGLQLPGANDLGDLVSGTGFQFLSIFSFILTLELFSGSLRFHNIFNIILNETFFRLLKTIVKTLKSRPHSAFLNRLIVESEAIINNENHHQTGHRRHYVPRFVQF
jgi:hypothetical protein